GPGGDRDVWWFFALLPRREADAGQRRPEVPFDVVGQCLEGRDIEDTDVARLLPGRRRTRIPREAVERVEEGGERLATPRRGVDESGVTTRDALPTARS